MELAPDRKTCSVEEAARMLGIGRNSAYAAIRDGSIPSLRLGRRVVVPLARLNRLIDGEDAPKDAA